MDIAEVPDNQVSEMAGELQLVVEYQRPQCFIGWWLVAGCPSVPFYLGRHLLSSKLCDWISYTYTVDVASLVLLFLVLLSQDLQLVLVAGFVQNDCVFDEVRLVWQLDQVNKSRAVGNASDINSQPSWSFVWNSDVLEV